MFPWPKSIRIHLFLFSSLFLSVDLRRCEKSLSFIFIFVYDFTCQFMTIPDSYFLFLLFPHLSSSYRPLFHNPVLWAETAFLIYLLCFLSQQDKEMCYFPLFIGDQNESLFESKGKNLYDVCPRCVSFLHNALAPKGL